MVEISAIMIHVFLSEKISEHKVSNAKLTSSSDRDQSNHSETDTQ